MMLGNFGFGSSGKSSSDAITGSGTAPKVPKFTAANTIGDSQITDNGTTVFIGASATSTKAVFEVKSTTQGVLFPRMTTAQRDLITVGATEDSLYIYNTTLQRYQYYDHTTTSWVSLILDKDIPTRTIGRTITPVSHTGNTNETYLVGLLIPANSYISADEIPIHLLASATTNNANKTIRGYINTTNSLVTGSPVLIMTTATNNLNYDCRRLFFVETSTNIIGLALPTQSLTVDSGANNAGNANITLPNFNQDLYFIVSVQLTSALDNFTLRAASIKRERL